MKNKELEQKMTALLKEHKVCDIHLILIILIIAIYLFHVLLLFIPLLFVTFLFTITWWMAPAFLFLCI